MCVGFVARIGWAIQCLMESIRRWCLLRVFEAVKWVPEVAEDRFELGLSRDR